MNGTKLPNAIKELGKEKEITLFVDGDRGGRLIIQNVSDNASIDYIAIAPDGKEVEELTGKEILINLRKKIPLNEFLKREGMHRRENKEIPSKIELDEEDKERLKRISKEIENSGKAILLDDSLEEIKEVSARGLSGSLKRLEKTPSVIVLDGTVTSPILDSAEEAGCQIIIAKNFAATSENIQLLSF